MTEFQITTGAVPANSNGRPAQPNLFMPEGKPNMFTAASEAGEAMIIRLDGDNKSNEETTKSLTSQARKAANAADLTARVSVTEEGKGKSAVTVFTTWARPKITRPRTQTGDAAASASASNPNTATA